MLEQEVLSDESRKLTPGDRSFCFNRTFFGKQCRCLQWELILFPAACLFFFFPPAILPVWFGWFSNTPVNPTHRATSVTSGRRAGTLCGVAHLAVHRVGALLHRSCQNTDNFLFIFSRRCIFFPPPQRDTGGNGNQRKSHPCLDLPVWSAPPCTEVRPFRGR